MPNTERSDNSAESAMPPCTVSIDMHMTAVVTASNTTAATRARVRSASPLAVVIATAATT